MSQHTFEFLVSQAARGIVFTAADAPNPLAPGNFAGWSSPSFKPTDSDVHEQFEEDGGQWVGTVQSLPDNVINMIATYFPVRGEPDNIQVTGPIMAAAAESAIAVVGGGGKYAGARGQARCVLGMSDLGAPVYRYAVTIHT